LNYEGFRQKRDLNLGVLNFLFLRWLLRYANLSPEALLIPPAVEAGDALVAPACLAVGRFSDGSNG